MLARALISTVAGRLVAISSTAGSTASVLIATRICASLSRRAETSIARVAEGVAARGRLVAVASTTSGTGAEVVAARVGASVVG